MTFWLIAAAIALLTAALLVLALMRGGRTQVPPAAYDLQVYRDQLKEVEKDLARGVVTPEDAKRVRLEVSRRILEADKRIENTASLEQDFSSPKLTRQLVAILRQELADARECLFHGLPASPENDQDKKASEREANQALSRVLRANRHFDPKRTPDAGSDKTKFAKACVSAMQAELDQIEELLSRASSEKADDDATNINVREMNLRLKSAAAEFGAAISDGRRIGKISGPLAAGLIVILVAGGSLALYERVGAPGYPDLPLQARMEAADEARATRPSQAEAEAQMPAMPQMAEPDPQHVKLVEQLREVVKQRGDDIQGYILLARNEAMLGNFRAAYAAQSKVIELKQGHATGEDFATYADMMILAAGGYVSPQAEAALVQALNRAPQNGTARYYAGLMYAQTGRPDITFKYWRPLLENSNPDDPWVAPIRAQIEEISFRAGVEYQPPAAPAAPALRGPSSEDMEAAADMTPEERMEMVRGMVENLGERLATVGGSAAEWAQLVNALGMLGETERAAAIWAEAQQVFAGQPEMLATVRAAAERVGVAE